MRYTDIYVNPANGPTREAAIKHVRSRNPGVKVTHVKRASFRGGWYVRVLTDEHGNVITEGDA
jgi:hypothetical protein